MLLLLRVVSLDQELQVDESSWEHGTQQAPSCRDWWAALLFLAQLAVVLTLAVLAVIAIARGDYDLPDTPKSKVAEFVGFFLVAALAIMVVSSSVILLLLGPLSDMLIQFSLVLSCISFGMSTVGALLVGQVPTALFTGVMCLFSILYAVRVWHRIPFATANLSMALSAIRSNKGLISMAYLTSFVALLWTIAVFLAFMQATVFHSHTTMSCYPDESGDMDCHLTATGKWVLVGLLGSFYWSSQVIKNTFHTTVAGVVGTFWFSPSDAQGSWCNAALYDSFVRSSVYSFGSICLGSLLVAVMQVLQFLIRAKRQQQEQNGHHNRQASLFYCLLQCIIDQVERLMEYINEWAFGTYLGLLMSDCEHRKLCVYSSCANH